MLTKIEVKQTIQTTDKISAYIIFQCIHSEALLCYVVVNMVGARRWCSFVLMLGHRRQWRHRFGVSWQRTPFTSIPHDDKTVIPCIIFQINNFQTLGAIII